MKNILAVSAFLYRFRPMIAAGFLIATSATALAQSGEAIFSNSFEAAPNVLFVIADDFGLDASPCHPSIGALKPVMPNLSALCSRGVVFDQAWAHPTCTPTRASVLSGKYVGEVLSSTDTILNRLQAGANPYAVAVIGKWHVSGANPANNAPAAFGASYFSGFLTGALTDYFNWQIITNGTPVQTNNYATTELTDKAIGWLNNRPQPWFLWLAYNAPHSPFHTPPANLYSQPGLQNGTATDNRTKYFAAAEALDAELGRLIAALPTATLANTTIVFLGDNGTPSQAAQAPVVATRAKDTLYQGGIQVPLVVAGARVSRIGQRDASLVNSEDLFATFSALTERTAAVPADSINFSPALSASNFSGRSHAYIDFRDNGVVVTAIRDARYKLIELASNQRQLYDLQVDPYELVDLTANGISPAEVQIIDSLVAKRAAFQQ
jgi:arylsulfatase B